MQRSIISSLVLVGVALAAPHAHAVRETHGGGGLVCNQQTSVDLLDLREAVESGLSIPRSDAPVEDQIEAAFKRLDGMSLEVGRLARANLRWLRARIAHPMPGRQLAPPPDALIREIPEGCFFVGVAQYDLAQQKLIVDPKWMDRMDNTAQAALWVHEAVYKLYRDRFDHSDSVKTRVLTGATFSNVALPKLISLKEPKRFLLPIAAVLGRRNSSGWEVCASRAEMYREAMASNPTILGDMRMAIKTGFLSLSVDVDDSGDFSDCYFNLVSYLRDYKFLGEKFDLNTRDRAVCAQETAKQKENPHYLFSLYEGHYISTGGLSGRSSCYHSVTYWQR